MHTIILSSILLSVWISDVFAHPTALTMFHVSKSSPVRKTISTRQFTADACTSNSDCSSPRNCFDRQDNSLPYTECTSSSTSCFCSVSTGDTLCSSSSTCLTGDRCVTSSSTGVTLCISCKLTETLGQVELMTVDSGSSCNVDITPTPTPLACIAISSLGDLQPSELVFSIHRQATVLCANLNNCATPGHMVEYKGIPMMMRSYCKISLDCITKVRLVNSPRMSVGLRLSSNSENLTFTALSAQHETKLEESVLHGLLRFVL